MARALTPELVLEAYRAGLFPMADWRTGRIGWYAPDPRGILPLDRYHVPRSLRQAAKRFAVTTDRAFEGVIDGCAARPATWISAEIRRVYVELFRRGDAHSVESWQGGALAGGLYGVHIGAAFFAESMFHAVTDGGKVALAALLDRLKARGFRLCDCQMVTPITARFGAVEIPRDEYVRRLGDAVRRRVSWDAAGGRGA